MKKLLLFLIISIVLLSGCKTSNEENMYVDTPKKGYALIVLSDETNIPTGEFSLVSYKSGTWEWDDTFAKFKDSLDNIYIVKIYYNDLDYKISINNETIVDTMSLKEINFDE
jgi:hypothetical protein